MSTHKKFAVVGPGNLGKIVINELLRFKAAGTISSVVVISRSEASTPEWKQQGAEFAIVDYDSPDTLASAFANVDVVVSTLNAKAFALQIEIAKVAKSASVKLFIPAEYGPAENTATTVYEIKKKVKDSLKEMDLPYSLFFTGFFSDFLFIPRFGFDFANGTANIGGAGNSPISFTTRTDIARFLVHVLTTLPPADLEWKAFRIEGDRLSWNDIISDYEKKTGKKLEVSYTPQEVLKERFATNPRDNLSMMLLAMDLGKGTVGETTDNHLWPEWNAKTVSDLFT